MGPGLKVREKAESAVTIQSTSFIRPNATGWLKNMNANQYSGLYTCLFIPRAQVSPKSQFPLAASAGDYLLKVAHGALRSVGYMVLAHILNRAIRSGFRVTLVGNGPQQIHI